MELDFKTKVDIEIDYDSEKPAGFEYESRSSSANIAYKLSIEVRDWGVKNFIFIMQAQELTLDIELQSQNSEDYESYTFHIKVDDVDIQDAEDFKSGDLCPTTLSLTLKDIVKKDSHSFEAKASGLLSF